MDRIEYATLNTAVEDILYRGSMHAAEAILVEFPDPALRERFAEYDRLVRNGSKAQADEVEAEIMLTWCNETMCHIVSEARAMGHHDCSYVRVHDRMALR